jgi:hypothetical protein
MKRELPCVAVPDAIIWAHLQADSEYIESDDFNTLDRTRHALSVSMDSSPFPQQQEILNSIDRLAKEFMRHAEFMVALAEIADSGESE